MGETEAALTLYDFFFVDTSSLFRKLVFLQTFSRPYSKLYSTLYSILSMLEVVYISALLF